MALYFTPANDHSESFAFSLISSESTLLISYLGQQSPDFLAPGTSFLEDNFSRDGGARDEGRVVQVVMQAVGSKWWEATDEASPLPVHGLGVGDPWPKWLKPGCHHSLHIRVKKNTHTQKYVTIVAVYPKFQLLNCSRTEMRFWILWPYKWCSFQYIILFEYSQNE